MGYSCPVPRKDHQKFGQVCISPSKFSGNPRYLHEHTQDTMAYVRHYGTPDRFINFICNPKWTEIINEIFTGQKGRDRHDLIARVFRHKLIAKMRGVWTSLMLHAQS